MSIRSAIGREHSLASARRDLLVLLVLIAAVVMLIWNGSALFQKIADDAKFGPTVKLAATTLTLNIALIMFGWRRYADLLHEAEMRRDSEERAALIASTDGMTCLLNRKGFADHGETLRREADLANRSIIIISLQLNRFKALNDRHGFDVGDEMLRRISADLTTISGEGALVARLAGDEFAIAMSTDSDGAPAVRSTAESLLRAVTRPMEISGRLVQVGAFFGIAASDPNEGSMPDFLRRADIALGRARSTCSAVPVWFDSGMEQAMVADSEIEQGIRFGLDHGHFVPYFEPQVDLLTGEILGFEVLARWNHPLRGLVGPDTFIPVAEEHGLIGRLSEQVMLAAMTQATQWDPSINLSVNISPSQLGDSWLAQRILRLVVEAGFTTDRLMVEITESSLFSDIDLARSIVESLKNQGVRIALDDFGTGYSSLSHLRSLPFDSIKVDRSFVSTLLSDRQSIAIVQAVTTLASALSIPVTVEGIENADTHAALAGMGCAVGQGWYFGKPMTGDQAAALLRDRDGLDQQQSAAAG